MGFTLWLSRKLRLNGSGGGANATGVAIAVAGVALALVVMEFTIGIVTGFKNSITERITGFDGQIWLQTDNDITEGVTAMTFVPDDALQSVVAATLPDARVTGRFTQPGLIKTDNDFAAVYFVAYEYNETHLLKSHDYTFERSFISSGRLPDFSNPHDRNAIVISGNVANALGIGLDDDVIVCFFVNDAVKSRKFKIAGIYDTGFGDYDKTIVFAGIDAMRAVAGTGEGSLTQLVVSGIDNDRIEAEAAKLEWTMVQLKSDGYGRYFTVGNARSSGRMYFNWLDLLDTNVVVIFILMICVAAFTLVSSMFIIILERIPTIGILRALGATKHQVRNVFISLSMKIVAIGMLIGNIAGLGLLLLQREFKLVPLDPEMYYLTHVPVEINWLHMLALNIGVIVVTWLVLVLPSRLASRISPAVTMRFE